MLHLKGIQEFSRNTLWVGLSSVLPAMFGLLALQPILEYLGNAYFTLLSFFWLLTGQLGLLDFGLSRTLLIELPKTPTHHQNGFLSYIAKQGVKNSLLGMLILILTVLLFSHYPSVEGVKNTNAYLGLLVCWVPLAIFQGLARSTFEGLKEFKIASMYKALNQLVLFLIPLLFTLWPKLGFSVLLWTITAARSILLFFSLNHLRIKGFKIEKPWKPAHPIQNQNIWITLSNFAGFINGSFERYYLLFLLGAVRLTEYVFTQDISVRILVLSVSMSTVLLPELSSKKELKTNHHWIKWSSVIVVMFHILVGLIVLLGKENIFGFFPSMDAEAVVMLFAIFLIGITANGVGHLLLSALHSERSTKKPALWHAISAVLYVVIVLRYPESILLWQVAVIWSARSIIDTLVLTYFWKQCRQKKE